MRSQRPANSSFLAIMRTRSLDDARVSVAHTDNHTKLALTVALAILLLFVSHSSTTCGLTSLHERSAAVGA